MERSMRVACARCGKWMFAAAVTCPHCGARQDVPEPPADGTLTLDDPEPPRPLKLSKDEVKALLDVSGAVPEKRPADDPVGLVSWLTLPQTQGPKRIFEILLTLVALPLLVLTIVAVAYWAAKYHAASRRGTATFGVLAVALMAVAAMLRADWPEGLVLLGIMVAAWLVRGALRGAGTRDISVAG